MKKSLFLLLACSTFCFTSCIEKIEGFVDQIVDGGNEGGNEGGSSENQEDIEDKVKQKLRSYADSSSGITIKGSNVFGGEYVCAGKGNIFYVESSDVKTYYDFSGDQAFMYMDTGETVIKQKATMSKDNAFETAFSGAIGVFSSSQANNSKASSKSGTFLGYTGKEYSYKDSSLGTSYSYKWFVSDSDGFTLWFETTITSNGETTPFLSGSTESISHSASITIPTEFTDLTNLDL